MVAQEDTASPFPCTPLNAAVSLGSMNPSAIYEILAAVIVSAATQIGPFLDSLQPKRVKYVLQNFFYNYLSKILQRQYPKITISEQILVLNRFKDWGCTKPEIQIAHS